MISATMHDAKTHLSSLVKKMQQGEVVVITSGREKTPVARIAPMEAVAPKRLGAWLTPGFELGESFWEPMTDEECGFGDDGIL